MKKFKATGLQLAILKEALLRPTEGATVDTFISIQRLVKPLKLRDTNVGITDTYDIELEDADFAFLTTEWRKANDPARPMWTRHGQGANQFNLIEAVVSVDTLLKEQASKNAPALE